MTGTKSIAGQNGIAVVACLLAMALLMVLGSALVLSTSVEAMIAGNFQSGLQNSAAAAAAVELAIDDLPTGTSWTPILLGGERSSFVDGPPGDRVLADGSAINLVEIVNLANCGRPAGCTVVQMDAITADRPWGANNPRWQLFAHGAMRDLLPSGTLLSDQYLVVLVGDDEGENDGNPLMDGVDLANPGSGTIVLRGEAFGPHGGHHAAEAAVMQAPQAARVVSWRDLARLDHP
jgi:hypothetical protein